VLTRLVATVAAIAALLGPVSLAQAQSDNERQEMLRGGATKKGSYNIFGFDGTDLGRTTVRYEANMRPAPSSSIRKSGGSISFRETARRCAGASVSAGLASSGRARTRSPRKKNFRLGRHRRRCARGKRTYPRT
jgi:hypothetical protein